MYRFKLKKLQDCVVDLSFYATKKEQKCRTIRMLNLFTCMYIFKLEKWTDPQENVGFQRIRLLATAKPIMSGISPGSDTIGTSMNHILTYARAYLYNWD